jgi:hypothetical protein
LTQAAERRRLHDIHQIHKILGVLRLDITFIHPGQQLQQAPGTHTTGGAFPARFGSKEVDQHLEKFARRNTLIAN